MILFLVTTAILTLIFIILFILYIYLIKKFKLSKIKKPWQYFLRPLASIVLVLLLVFIISPMLIDSLDIFSQNTEVINIEVADTKAFRVEDTQKRKYSYSKFEEDIEKGESYQAKLTKRFNFAYDFTKIQAENPNNDAASENGD